MANAVRVAVLSPLLQLDREFDFLVPDSMNVSVGQRVTFPFGRTKKPMTGFVTAVLESSEFAKTYLLEAIPGSVLTSEILSFARAVANRQCVALGEILALAIPDHMPKIQLPPVASAAPKLPPGRATRVALLGSGRLVKHAGGAFPDWATEFISRAKDQLANGYSSLLLVPEQADLQLLVKLAEFAQLEVEVLAPGMKKSDRFVQFHRILNQVKVVVGTRSAIYAPIANLGLIAVSDDLDESLREEGSPHTHVRELALMRAEQNVSLLFAAPYRSIEIQRLVDIGYLKEVEIAAPPPRISFTEPGYRIDEAAFKLVRESLKVGTVLVLLPRKGMSAAAWCDGCGERQRCSCGGFIWEPEAGIFQCRVCSKVHVSCPQCSGRKFRPGRRASGRTLSDIGKAFPNAIVSEATASKRPTKSGKANQILVATPGSAPRIDAGYSALLVLDPDVWLSSQSLNAEQLALRDWCEAMELVSPGGRIVISGLGAELGQPLALWQHRELARAALNEARSLQLPPAVRTVTVSGSVEAVADAANELARLGCRRVRQRGDQASFTFSYQEGPKVSRALRAIALKTGARGPQGAKRRGLKIVMDDLGL